MVRIAKGGWTSVILALVIPGVVGFVLNVFGRDTGALFCYALSLVACGYMVYFFRDPERDLNREPDTILAGADGWVRSVEKIAEQRYLNTETVRISTFLTPFDVHVNRSPIKGKVTALTYTPGKHLLTIQQASSERNEHSSILIEGENIRCLVKQIVGPIVRRVVYWLRLEQDVMRGERIGLMKFGSRLDVYLPAADVEVLVGKGDRVKAGQTVIARLTTKKINL